jgi:hypothetical protein
MQDLEKLIQAIRDLNISPAEKLNLINLLYKFVKNDV